MTFCFEPIGILHSCFKEKFGIPRQPGLIPEAEGRLEILPPYDRPEAFTEIDGYSHLWITFVFHAVIESPSAVNMGSTETIIPLHNHWKPTVRPPRLGGNQRVGVFASRSPFRPNPIGLSVVELKSVQCSGKEINLVLGGVDLLDGTPVLDIKPYLPYADIIPDASAGFAPTSPCQSVTVLYSAEADAFLHRLQAERSAHLRRLIQQIMEHDPRPAYLKGKASAAAFGMHLYDYNIQWRTEAEQVIITNIQRINPQSSSGRS